jgi:hypothetical protein
MNAAGGLQSPRESIEPAKLNLAAAAAFKPDQQWPARGPYPYPFATTAAIGFSLTINWNTSGRL